MSFEEKPGMMGNVRRVRELYRWVTPAHLASERERALADNFLD